MNVTEMSFNSTTTETITQVNATLQPQSEDEILGPSLVWTFVSLHALQGIFAMVGNLITIIAVLKYEPLWDNSACRMVVALAVADFFGGFSPLLGRLSRQLFSSVSVLKAICYVRVHGTRMLSVYGNVYFILLITIDRFIFITRPLRYFTIVTPQRALKAISIAWMLIFLQIVLMVAITPSPRAITIQQCGWNKAVGNLAFYIRTGQFVLITCCVIVPLYGVIGYMAWKESKDEPHISNYPPESQAIQKAKLRERKMVKTIGLVLGTYLTCYTPVIVFPILMNISGYTKPFPFEFILTNRILIVVYNFQWILNPFIYGWKNLQFRKAYQKLLFTNVPPAF